MGVLQEYNIALIKNDADKCILIEENYDLYGYPPELVSVGLQAIDNGLDPLVAIEDYINVVY